MDKVPTDQMKAMGLLARMREIARDKGLNNESFDKSLGKSNGYLSTLIKQGSLPSTGVIIELLDKYPEYNPLWILKGQGEKFNPAPGAVGENAISYGDTIPGIIDLKALEEYIKQVFEKNYGDQIEQMQEQLDIRFKRSLQNNGKNNSKEGLG